MSSENHLAPSNLSASIDLTAFENSLTLSVLVLPGAARSFCLHSLFRRYQVLRTLTGHFAPSNLSASIDLTAFCITLQPFSPPQFSRPVARQAGKSDGFQEIQFLIKLLLCRWIRYKSWSYCIDTWPSSNCLCSCICVFSFVITGSTAFFIIHCCAARIIRTINCNCNRHIN